MKFTKTEKRDLINAGVMISLAFAILLAGGFQGLLSFSPVLLILFVMSFFTAGIGFLLHEIMHKYIAQSYGFKAKFVAFYNMLWLALFFSLFGFIIAAPGGVMIKGEVTKEKNGKISLAGPMTNIVLAGIFLILLLLFGNFSVLVKAFLSFGLLINALLGAFNMLPFGLFDGSKVLRWNKTAYFVSLGIAVALLIMSFGI